MKTEQNHAKGIWYSFNVYFVNHSGIMNMVYEYLKMKISNK